MDVGAIISTLIFLVVLGSLLFWASTMVPFPGPADPAGQPGWRAYPFRSLIIFLLVVLCVVWIVSLFGFFGTPWLVRVNIVDFLVSLLLLLLLFAAIFWAFSFAPLPAPFKMLLNFVLIGLVILIVLNMGGLFGSPMVLHLGDR